MSASFCINANVSSAIVLTISTVSGIPIILIKKIQTVYMHKNRQFLFTVHRDSFAQIPIKRRHTAYAADSV